MEFEYQAVIIGKTHLMVQKMCKVSKEAGATNTQGIRDWHECSKGNQFRHLGDQPYSEVTQANIYKNRRYRVVKRLLYGFQGESGVGGVNWKMSIVMDSSSYSDLCWALHNISLCI